MAVKVTLADVALRAGVSQAAASKVFNDRADVSAATPSHAAQLLVPDKQDLIRAAHRDVIRISNIVESALTGFSADARHILTDILRAIDDQVRRMSDRVRHQLTVLDAYDPTAVLARGYAIVRGTVEPGSSIEIEQTKRFITAEVKDVRKK